MSAFSLGIEVHFLISFRSVSNEPIASINRLNIWVASEPNKWPIRLMIYNWQQSDWPNFRFDLTEVEDDLLRFSDKAGQVSGLIRGLPEGTRTRAILDVMIAEAIKTSEIEGEYLSRPDVASSIRNQFGWNKHPEVVKDLASKGAAELMFDVRESWDAPLSGETLFHWHRILFQGARGVSVGSWRVHTEPMRVISGAVGKTKVHFEAPPSVELPDRMHSFVQWFNKSSSEVKQAPVRSALAHLYFESLHPFEDGNGRIGRAVSEKALSQGLGRPALLSLSQVIEANKSAYYDALERAQRSNEVTLWIRFFVGVVAEAQANAEEQIDFVLRKTKFFDVFKAALNERQLKVVRRMLDEGPSGFEGGMNARKYGSLTGVSKATATRDLQALVDQGALVAVGGGRSTRYELKL